MKFVSRNGVQLAYEDTGSKLPAIVFVHGLACDHQYFVEQVSHFAANYRVITVDLRGHGQSDAPLQDYTMSAFADDVVWLCKELDVIHPIFVGHSMGGNVVLQLASLYPHFAAAVVLIDTVVFPTEALLVSLQPLVDGVQLPNYIDVLRAGLSSLCLSTDKKTAELIAAISVSQHVLVSALPNQLHKYDSMAAASGCRVPTAYIGAAISLAQLPLFLQATPQLMIGQTIGAGHFSPSEVPEQINAMIDRFLTISEIQI